MERTVHNVKSQKTEILYSDLQVCNAPLKHETLLFVLINLELISHMTIMLNNETLGKHLIHKCHWCVPLVLLTNQLSESIKQGKPFCQPTKIPNPQKPWKFSLVGLCQFLFYSSMVIPDFNLSWKWNYYPENELFITYHFPFLLINLATFLPKWSWIVRDMYGLLVVCAWT